MGKFKFSELRDIAQGDFAIKDGGLFYKDKQIAAAGTVLFDSSEEVFFLFKVADEQLQTQFKQVVFLNYFRCSFYPCNEYQRTGDELRFTQMNGKKFLFRRYCYNGNINSSKIIGGTCRD